MSTLVEPCLTLSTRSDDQIKQIVLKFVDDVVKKVSTIDDEEAFDELANSITSVILSVHWRLGEKLDQRNLGLDLIAVLCSAFIDVLSAKNKRFHSVSDKDSKQIAEQSFYFLNGSIEHLLDSVLFSELMNKNDKNWWQHLFNKIDNEISKLAASKLDIGLYLKCITFYHKRLDYFCLENEKPLKKSLQKLSVPENIKNWTELNKISFPPEFDYTAKKFLKTKYVTPKVRDQFLDILAGTKNYSESIPVTDSSNREIRSADLEIQNRNASDKNSDAFLTLQGDSAPSAANANEEDDDFWPSDFNENEIVVYNFEIDKMPEKDNSEIEFHESVSNSSSSVMAVEEEIDEISGHSGSSVSSEEPHVEEATSPVKRSFVSEKISPLKQKGHISPREKPSPSPKKSKDKIDIDISDTFDAHGTNVLSSVSSPSTNCEAVKVKLTDLSTKKSPVRQMHSMPASPKKTVIENEGSQVAVTRLSSVNETNEQLEVTNLLNKVNSPYKISNGNDKIGEISESSKEKNYHSLRKRVPSMNDDSSSSQKPKRQRSKSLSKTETKQEKEKNHVNEPLKASPVRQVNSSAVERLAIQPEEQKTPSSKERVGKKSVSPKSAIKRLDLEELNNKTENTFLSERRNLRRRVPVNYSEPRALQIARVKKTKVTPKMKKSLVNILETGNECKTSADSIKPIHVSTEKSILRRFDESEIDEDKAEISDVPIEKVNVQSDESDKKFRYATRSRRSIL